MKCENCNKEKRWNICEHCGHCGNHNLCDNVCTSVEGCADKEWDSDRQLYICVKGIVKGKYPYGFGDII